LNYNLLLDPVNTNYINSCMFYFQNNPVIMIGPGTGVAPFCSYIHERVALGHASDKLLYLFFGCQNKNGDFHCSEEWLTLQEKRPLSLFCAFSRDQEYKM